MKHGGLIYTRLMQRFARNGVQLVCYADILTGRVTGHVCQSVCPVWAPNSNTKKHRKTEIGVSFPPARVTGVPVFTFGGQR